MFSSTSNVEKYRWLLSVWALNVLLSPCRPILVSPPPSLPLSRQTISLWSRSAQLHFFLGGGAWLTQLQEEMQPLLWWSTTSRDFLSVKHINTNLWTYLPDVKVPFNRTDTTGSSACVCLCCEWNEGWRNVKWVTPCPCWSGKVFVWAWISHQISHNSFQSFVQLYLYSDPSNIQT